MIVSLIEDDMITFYEIHERFDNLNIFDSKHEKDISQRLINIGNGIENLINLEVLDCSHNNLTDLNEMKNLINLKVLYCFGNNLPDDYRDLIVYCRKKNIKLILW
jgi:hypothetical protein